MSYLSQIKAKKFVYIMYELDYNCVPYLLYAQELWYM